MVQCAVELHTRNYEAGNFLSGAPLSSIIQTRTEIRVPDRLHSVRQFITVSCTCSESNSSAKDLHADGLLPREDPRARARVRACRGARS